MANIESAATAINKYRILKSPVAPPWGGKAVTDATMTSNGSLPALGTTSRQGDIFVAPPFSREGGGHKYGSP